MKTDPNDLVNPSFVNINPDDRGYTHNGLTKREHFASMAMQGLLAADNQGKAVAIMACEAADGLIAELNKQDVATCTRCHGKFESSQIKDGICGSCADDLRDAADADREAQIQ